ncbi:galactoside 2-alpha-L-fucosyltransferase SEC1-like [Argopecten irradians]|uniref:galactoside 2-alpha-L-fucosyltransferase SEC1-like n=1 Tax=Argopecten irradians TaxID=31199 RepID=UPI003720C956
MKRCHSFRFLRKDVVYIFLGVSVGLNMFLLWQRTPTGTGNKNEHLIKDEDEHVRKFYIFPFLQGGLGNLMFQYASVYGIAKSNGVEIGLYSDNELYKIFELIPPTVKERRVYFKAHRFIGSNKECAYDARNIDIPKQKDVVHLSFLQSWKYFADVEHDIRKQYVFRKEIRDAADDLIKKQINKYRTFVNHKLTIVGVHVRRGDYLDKDKQRFGYRIADADYFHRTMSFFRSKYGHVLFMIFTNPEDDDMTWCKSNLSGNDVVFMFGNPRGVDLCILSRCDHVITSVGTFGWWAAFLNNGTKTYFRDFVKPGSDYEQCFKDNGYDYFYPGWLGF